VLEAGARREDVQHQRALRPERRAAGRVPEDSLFDAEVGDGASYRESDAVAPGDRPVTVETPLGTVGLSVCYDLRFPELYRALSAAGAVILTVPSAFTLMTGKDHWEVLLRARAIENQAYVLAPAQGGRHTDQRFTYGQAMVVDPWGLVTARASDGEGLALVEFDPGCCPGAAQPPGLAPPPAPPP
jgi:predicted amidohydrolase